MVGFYWLDIQQRNQEYGEYPVEAAGDETGSKCLYQALSGDGTDAISGITDSVASIGEPGSAGKVFLDDLDPMDDPQNMIDKASGGYILVDPFKVEYNYSADPNRNPKYNTSYDLWSYGTGSKDDTDTAKWIKNW